MAFTEVTEQNVYQCTGSPNPQDMETIMRWLMEEDFAIAFDNIWRLMSDKGLALQDVLTELHSYVLLLDVKDAVAKAMLVASIADVEFRLSVGTNEKLQLGGLVGIFQQAKISLVQAAA